MGTEGRAETDGLRRECLPSTPVLTVPRALEMTRLERNLGEKRGKREKKYSTSPSKQVSRQHTYTV